MKVQTKILMQRAVSKEDAIIGNLKQQFIRPTLNGQRKIGISPDICNGNISLAYHRGLNIGRDEMLKEVLRELKNFPEAKAHIKKTIHSLWH
jgi:hypothetical protein